MNRYASRYASPDNSHPDSCHARFVSHAYRSPDGHWYVEYICATCGWASRAQVPAPDLSEPVTSDEILAVHEALQQGDWWLT